MSRHLASPPRPFIAFARKTTRLTDAIGRALRSAARNWKRRKMIAALDALDDRTLQEIGVHRAEIGRLWRHSTIASW